MVMVVCALAVGLCVAQVLKDQPLPLPDGADRGAAVQFLDPQQVTLPARHTAQIREVEGNPGYPKATP